LVISNQTKQAFAQKNRAPVQPAINVQSIQIEETPDIQLDLGELIKISILEEKNSPTILSRMRLSPLQKWKTTPK
jgi:hypothetical protein